MELFDHLFGGANLHSFGPFQENLLQFLFELVGIRREQLFVDLGGLPQVVLVGLLFGLEAGQQHLKVGGYP
jgi:hypothetical protein